VSSEAPPGRHRIQGFRLAEGVSFEELVRFVESRRGAQLEELESGFARLEFRSRLLGFVDDVELECAGADVQVRSCSRVGYWDLGANRRRVEALRRGLGAAGLVV
jgi:uncharacterized protein (DUF1499 family)